MNLQARNDSPFSIPNIRLFIAFRVFFNSRFYYPVFTILFLDFGLSVAQFALLNAIWAATIVLAEVPSGALADIVGRKRLLVFATATMIVEIGIITFIPRVDPWIIFMVFMVNRVLSGLAEAAASGADEAIAYDSLTADGNPEHWGNVLEVLTRFQSIGFIVAMSIGAAVYDPNLMDLFFRSIGVNIPMTQEITMRFPLYLTFGLAICAFITTLKMTDPQADSQADSQTSPSPAQAAALTLKAGIWIIHTPFALAVILFGMMFDGLIRMVITLSSQYYRMIDLPESVFGLLGSLVALLGLVIPKIANRIASKGTPAAAVFVTALLAGTGLLTMNFFWSYWGMIPALITFCAMYFTGFFVSFYLNRAASSAMRATVLSFKGLAYNISYGLLGISYALILKAGKQGPSEEAIENAVFVDTFFCFPLTFFIWFALLVAAYFLWLAPPKN